MIQVLASKQQSRVERFSLTIKRLYGFHLTCPVKTHNFMCYDFLTFATWNSPQNHYSKRRSFLFGSFLNRSAIGRISKALFHYFQIAQLRYDISSLNECYKYSKMVKQLFIPKINTKTTDLIKISHLLDQDGTKGAIDVINWQKYPYKPEVGFTMAYNPKNLFIRFYVREKHIRAMETLPNGNVWEDSCCEFFCAFDDQGYYNIETNCIGTQLIGWGEKRENRGRLNDQTINAVMKESSLERKILEPQTGNFNYQLTLMIPASTFVAHPGLKFKPGMQFKANFYKCGDKTPEPHFLSWNAIRVEQPDFHRPEFFGTIELA
jgi:hypothetical protein